MKNQLASAKGREHKSRGAIAANSMSKKFSKVADNMVQSRQKRQLDMELFEHHLLGFGPCG